MRAPALVQSEFAPVISALLPVAVSREPREPAALVTVPPSEMTRLLPLPNLPILRPWLLVHSESAPVTSTLLLEEVVSEPM